MDVQSFENVLGIEEQSFEFIIGIIGVSKFNEFYLIELVLTC